LLFDGATALGDSGITDNGTTISTTEAVDLSGAASFKRFTDAKSEIAKFARPDVTSRTRHKREAIGRRSQGRRLFYLSDRRAGE
jgi:hypothetical protein